MASRKQLLVAESELNRAQLTEDLVEVSVCVRQLTSGSEFIRTIASSAATLVAGLAALQRGRAEASRSKPSWGQAVLKYAGLASSLWVMFRSKKPNPTAEESKPRETDAKTPKERA